MKMHLVGHKWHLVQHEGYTSKVEVYGYYSYIYGLPRGRECLAEEQPPREASMLSLLQGVRIDGPNHERRGGVVRQHRQPPVDGPCANQGYCVLMQLLRRHAA